MKKLFTGLLETLNRYLNELPEKSVKRFTHKYVHAPSVRGRHKKRFSDRKDLHADLDMSFKGSAYNGKGNVNTDNKTFNRPRKDIPRGREH